MSPPFQWSTPDKTHYISTLIASTQQQKEDGHLLTDGILKRQRIAQNFERHRTAQNLLSEQGDCNIMSNHFKAAMKQESLYNPNCLSIIN